MLNLRIYHDCKANAQAIGQLAMCRIMEKFPGELITQNAIYTHLHNNGFIGPQKTRRHVWNYVQSMLLWAKIPSITDLSECL